MNIQEQLAITTLLEELEYFKGWERVHYQQVFGSVTTVDEIEGQMRSELRKLLVQEARERDVVVGRIWRVRGNGRSSGLVGNVPYMICAYYRQEGSQK